MLRAGILTEDDRVELLGERSFRCRQLSGACGVDWCITGSSRAIGRSAPSDPEAHRLDRYNERSRISRTAARRISTRESHEPADVFLMSEVADTSWRRRWSEDAAVCPGRILGPDVDCDTIVWFNREPLRRYRMISTTAAANAQPLAFPMWVVVDDLLG